MASFTSSPFNMFNLFSIIVIALAAFFLFKRYKDKQAVNKAHILRPSSIIPPPDVAPVSVEEVKAD